MNKNVNCIFLLGSELHSKMGSFYSVMKLMVQACDVTTPMLIFKSIIDSYTHYIQNLPLNLIQQVPVMLQLVVFKVFCLKSNSMLHHCSIMSLLRLV